MVKKKVKNRRKKDNSQKINLKNILMIVALVVLILFIVKVFYGEKILKGPYDGKLTNPDSIYGSFSDSVPNDYSVPKSIGACGCPIGEFDNTQTGKMYDCKADVSQEVESEYCDFESGPPWKCVKRVNKPVIDCIPDESKFKGYCNADIHPNEKFCENKKKKISVYKLSQDCESIDLSDLEIMGSAYEIYAFNRCNSAKFTSKEVEVDCTAQEVIGPVPIVEVKGNCGLAKDPDDCATKGCWLDITCPDGSFTQTKEYSCMYEFDSGTSGGSL